MSHKALLVFLKMPLATENLASLGSLSFNVPLQWAETCLFRHFVIQRECSKRRQQRQVKNSRAVIRRRPEPPTPRNSLRYSFLTTFSSCNVYRRLPLSVVSLSKVSVVPSQQQSKNSHGEIPEGHDSWCLALFWAAWWNRAPSCPVPSGGQSAAHPLRGRLGGQGDCHSEARSPCLCPGRPYFICWRPQSAQVVRPALWVCQREAAQRFLWVRTRVQCSKIVIRRRERKSLIYKLNFIVNIYMKKKHRIYKVVCGVRRAYCIPKVRTHYNI